ncbi:CGNR zinc finger domain-containing protein [Nonomuraea rubra]|uniref:Putative RNA-binding Zn ribbon-like protein n=1 Tax=Nonomuraea rubra TaxID=46180 RepID=A0A7X0U0I2_9ACTN|nr:ABATE domain-containing protein [Nonomuraea rubra]MBB6550636.1 putative RNA-binding Zn ribbon-like protein [Nonomuraea rubra]
MAANDAWIRDGGRVCLDFVNTLRDRWDVPRETLEEPEDLVRWLHGAGLVVPGARLPAQPGAALRSARLLREAIDRAVLGAAGGGLPALADVDTINEAVAAAPRPLLQLVIADGRLEQRAERLAGDVVAGLGLVARDAAELLLSPEVGRVRVCGSDRCALRFVDRSQGGRRRWCSMSRCGNRTKVRRHQERVRN